MIASRAVARWLLALAFLAGCSQTKVVKRQGVEMPPVQFALRSLTYPSGLRVLVERDTRTKLAGIFVVVGAGSTSDPAGKEGLAHYVEHLTFRSRHNGGAGFAGDGRRPQAGAYDGSASFRALLEQAGAFASNAFTGFDSTEYFELGPASELAGLLRAEGARMLDPVANVPDAVFATELDVVKNELRQDNETGFPGDVMADMQAAVFPIEHPYERPVIGTLRSLGTLGAADARDFAKAHYRPENMTLLLIGDIVLETADRVIAENLPGELLSAPSRVQIPQRMPAAAPAVPTSPPLAAKLERRTAPVRTPQIWIGWSLPRSFGSDEYLLAFVRQAAQQRLGRVAFDDKDIARIRVDVIPGVQASMLICRIVLFENAHPEESRDRVLDELPRIWTTSSRLAEDLREYAFSIERRVVTVAEVSSAQSLVARGLRRATVTHFSQDPTVYSRAVRDLTAMRRKQISDFAAPYITRERARAMLFVPRAGTLATTAPEASEATAIADPETDRRPASLEPAEATDANRIVGRLRNLFLEEQTSTTRLPNGLTVVMEKRTGLPLVSVGLLLPTVRHSVKESAAAEVAWLAARPEFLQNAPEAFGAFVRRWHTADAIVYAVEGASGNTEALLATLAEYARSLSVARRDWVSIHDVVIPIWKRDEKDPGTIASRKLVTSLLRGTRYGMGPTVADLEQSSKESVTDWIEKTHSPANATLSIVGDFDPQAVKGWVEESFGNWSGRSAEASPGQLAAARDPSPSSEEEVLVTDRPGATQTQLVFACLLPRAGDRATARRYAVGATVLQERLWRVAREELGATYGPGVLATIRRGGIAYLEVRSMIEPGKLAPVLGALKRTMLSIGSQAVPPDELAAAQMRVAGSEAEAQMTNLGIVFGQLMRARMGYPIENPDPVSDLASVSAEDIRNDFKACRAGNPTLSLVGSEKNVRVAVQAGWR